MNEIALLAILLFFIVLFLFLQKKTNPVKGIILSSVIYFAFLLIDSDVLNVINISTILLFYFHLLCLIFPLMLVTHIRIEFPRPLDYPAIKIDRLIYTLAVVSFFIAAFDMARIFSTVSIQDFSSNAISYRNSITQNAFDENYYYQKSTLNSVINYSLLIALAAMILSKRFDPRYIKILLLQLFTVLLISIVEISRFHIIFFFVIVIFSPFFWTALKHPKGRKAVYTISIISLTLVFLLSVLTGKLGVEGYIDFDGLVKRFSLVFYYFQNYAEFSHMRFGGVTFFPVFDMLSRLSIPVEPVYLYNYAPSYYNENWTGIQPFGFLYYFINDFGKYGSYVLSMLCGYIVAMIYLLARMSHCNKPIGLLLAVYLFFSFSIFRFSQYDFWLSIIFVFLISLIVRAKINNKKVSVE